MNPLIELEKTTPIILICFMLSCFALSPTGQIATGERPSLLPPVAETESGLLYEAMKS